MPASRNVVNLARTQCKPTTLFFVVAIALLATTMCIELASAAGPVATIGGGVAEGESTNKNRLEFDLSAQLVPGSIVAFDCSFDSSAMEPCNATDDHDCFPVFCRTNKIFENTPDGAHALRVQALSCIEWTDCTIEFSWTYGPIATRNFVVDRIPPAVTVISKASRTNPSSTANVRFDFVVTERAARLRCNLTKVDSKMPQRVGANPFGGHCSKPFITPPFSNGDYSLAVIPIDPAGNEGAAVVYEYSVDAFKPSKCKKPKGKPAKSVRAKAKYKRCVKRNIQAKAKWKKRHGLA